MTTTQLKSDIESLWMRKIFLTFIVLTFAHIIFAQNKQTIVVRPETNLEKTVREVETAKEVIGFFGELFQGAAADRLNEVKNSSYNVFVEKKLETWKKKGAFEKTEDWQKRLNDSTAIKKSEIYESALDEFVQTFGVLLNSNKSLNGLFYDSKGYDSDKEVLVVNTVWGNTPIPIPLDEAKNMQDDFQDLNTSFLDQPHVGLKPHFFIQNDRLALVSLTFPCQGKIYTWENPSQSAQIARNKRLELERLDSLELATYNQKLDSIFKDYNRQLLQNPYNLTERVLTDYRQVTGKESRESNFNNRVSSMKSNFENLNNDFSSKYESGYGRYGRFFASKDEFDAFYKQGIDIYSQGIKVLDYLSYRSQNIADMYFNPLVFLPALYRQVYKRNGANLYSSSEEEILSTIRDCQSKPYYPQVIDFVIKTNKGLNNEWSENGKFFENKVEFYAACLSDDYKKILKTNKKTLKAN